jgi:P-type Ca2+ transporter type 2C
MAPRQSSSGMGERKKRASLASIPLTPIASSSSYHNPGQLRSDSPPASAYFPLLSADRDSNARLRPVPDAEAHFSYSTSLRRHPTDLTLAYTAQAVNAEASSLWSRVVGAITGKRKDGDHEELLGNGRGIAEPPAEAKRDTASARFAHYSVEVCLGFFNFLMFDCVVCLNVYL